MAPLASLLERRRGLLWAILAALTLLALVRLPHLRFDAVVRGFFASDDGEFQRLLEVFRTFGSDDVEALLLVEDEDVLSPRAVAAQRELARAARALPGVGAAWSAADVPAFSALGLPRPLFPPDGAAPEAWAEARAAALEHPLLAGHLIAKSGKLAAISVRLAIAHPSVEEMAPVVRELAALAHRVARERALKVHVSGVPAVRVEIYGAMRRDQMLFLAVGAAFGVVLLQFLFRSAMATLVAASAAWVSVVWALGALAWAGEPLNLLSAALPTLVLVVAFADAVHLLADQRISLAAGAAPRAASISTLRHLGGACFITSFTTAVGFGSLAMTGIPLIQRFGIACAAGTALAFFVVVIGVPLVAGTQRIGLRLAPRAGDGGLGAHPLLSRFACGCTELAIAWPRTIVVAAVALSAASCWFALRLEPENSLREHLPSGGRAEAALDLVDRELGGILALSIAVRARDETNEDPRAIWAVLEEVEAAALREPYLSRPFSPLSLVRALPGEGELAARASGAIALFPDEIRRRFWNETERSALLLARVPSTGTRALQPTLERLRRETAAIASRHPGFDLALTGTPVVAGANLNRMIGDLASSLGWAAAVIFLSMGLLFRSWKLGLISILPNALPLLMTAAALQLGGNTLKLAGVITFSICLGIAVDDTTHFIARYRRERKSEPDVPEALRRTARAVGLPMITTTLVFVGGFGTLALSALPGLREFGLLAVVAMATALLGDLIVLPALLALGAGTRWKKDDHRDTEDTEREKAEEREERQ